MSTVIRLDIDNYTYMAFCLKQQVTGPHRQMFLIRKCLLFYISTLLKNTAALHHICNYIRCYYCFPEITN